MQQLPNCPQCNCEYTYEDGHMIVCPECGHEFTLDSAAETVEEIKDSNGNALTDGDAVTIIKDLKVKGASSAIKKGTKVKNIRLVLDASDGHNIDCRIPGFGAMALKSEFVKKLN